MKATRGSVRNDGSVYISVPEAAENLRVSRSSIKRLLAQNSLTRYKVGRRTLLRRDQVLSLVKEA